MPYLIAHRHFSRVVYIWTSLYSSYGTIQPYTDLLWLYCFHNLLCIEAWILRRCFTI